MVVWQLAVWVVLAGTALAAPYAAIVMDARTGQVLHSHNADTRLHPASLTKMMTLYVAFDAIRRGEITLDTMVTISAKAAAEPPSKLGMRTGQRIAMRNLIRAAALRSANDAATAIGEAISGSESAFAARMTRTAKALGMNNTTFRNAHGLTADGHLSTARDMNMLGRRLFYDFPQYYNIFSRITADAGVAQVANTNRRFLESYRGADGIKTGYTRAAGFNLTASAERGNKRIIATVFGGTSTAQRNQKMSELMDIGFGNAPARVAVQPPAPVALDRVANASGAVQGNGAGRSAAKTIRLQTAVARSLRPKPRPGPVQPAPEMLVALREEVRSVLDEVAAPTPAPAEVALAAVAPQQSPVPQPRPEAAPDSAAEPAPAVVVPAVVVQVAETAPAPPPPAPETLAFAAAVADAEAAGPDEDLRLPTAEAGDDPDSIPERITMTAALVVPPTTAAAVSTRPQPRPGEIVMTAARGVAGPAPAPAAAPDRTEVMTRVSTSGGRHWGVNLGRFPSRGAAERALLQTALSETRALDGALRKVTQRGGGFDANFMGLSQEQADLACRRLQARAIQCFTLGP